MNGHQPQTQTVQTQVGQSSTDFQKLLEKPHESKALEFVPYGQTDKIKLSVPVVQKLIAVRTRTGATCSDRDAMRFMMMCQAQRLNPFAGDAFLIGYDSKDGPQFSLITAHQAFLKRAELHPEYDGMESGTILLNEDGSIVEADGDFHLSDQKVIGGWAKVHFKNRKVPTKRRLRVERFRKSFGVWQDDPAGMIVKCAEADALRSSFPTLLGGLYLRDEIDLKMETTVAVDLPANSIVEVRGAPHRTDNQSANSGNDDGDLGPQKPETTATAAPAAPARQVPIQEELAAEVTNLGYSFDVFARAMEQSGTLKDATSFSEFSEIKSDDATRILKSLRGTRSKPAMVQALETAKGEML